ncbi:MAG TPA: TIGR03118 family protein [Gemmataceae bacterium]
MHLGLRELWMARQGRSPRRKPLSRHPTVECLEGRCLLAGNVLQTNLVSDLPGVAQQLDPHLVNPWGISESAGSPFWVSDNNAGVATLYNTAGVPQSLVVSIPSPGDPLGNSGTPTGTVFNPDLAGGGFMISGVDKTGAKISAPAIFLFATEDGTIVGWNPNVNPVGFDPAKAGTYGIIAVDNSTNPTAADGAVYKGLTVATDPTTGQTLLYASNFRHGTVDVFGTDFKPATTLPAGAFTDPKLPKGYAPFNVQELNGKIYVTYAKQDKAKHDDVAGPGHGFVDVFNLDGSPGLAGGNVRLVSRGQLDSPWGLAIAPSSFGNLAGALLVGNFGNGRINAYDATTGKFLGALKDPDGEPIQIDGLWALRVGNGGNGGDNQTVYFTAGLFGETHGLFGSLTPVAAGTPEGPAEAQMVTAAFDVVQIDLSTLLTDIANGASRTTIRQDEQNLHAAIVQFIQAETRFERDERADLFPHGKGREHSGESAASRDLDILDAVFADLAKLPGDFR